MTQSQSLFVNRLSNYSLSMPTFMAAEERNGSQSKFQIITYENDDLAAVRNSIPVWYDWYGLIIRGHFATRAEAEHHIKALELINS